MEYFAYVENFRPSGPLMSWTGHYEERQKPRVNFKEGGALYTILENAYKGFKHSEYLNSRAVMKELHSTIDISLKVIEASTKTHDTLDARAELNAGRKVIMKALAEGSRIVIKKIK